MSKQPRAISPLPQLRALAYTIATLVTKPDQYAEMTASFRAGGFDGDDCEYIYLDNAGGNSLSAYQGLNRLLDEAAGTHVILCHQDVRLLADGRAVLDQRLADLAQRTPNWALAGNAGGIGPGKLALRISDPHGKDVRVGNLPEQVHSLDENFIVARRAARVAFSRDLDGFHFYGTDLCLQAELAGWSAHVIDFHLEHLSGGFKSPDFYVVERQFREKYARAFRARWIQTTCALVPLSANPALNLLGNAVARPFARLARKLPSGAGWAHQRPASPANQPKA